MSLAEQTRQAVDRDPVLYAALERGLVNYTAAANALDISGSQTAVVDALRRYAQTIEATATKRPRIRVSRSGELPTAATAAGIDPTTVTDADAVVVLSNCTWPQLAVGLCGLEIAGISVTRVAAADTTAVLVVPQTAAAAAVRVLEETLG